MEFAASATWQCLFWKPIEIALADAGNKCQVTSASGSRFLHCVTCEPCHTGLDSRKEHRARRKVFGHCLPYSMYVGGISALSVTGMCLVQ